MKWSQVMRESQRIIAVHPDLVRVIGPAAAILFCQLFFWAGKGAKSNKWFYKSAAELEEETGIPARTQRFIRANLKSLGIIEESHNRTLHRMYYKINIQALDRLMSGPLATIATATGKNGRSYTEKTQPSPTLPPAPSHNFMPITDHLDITRRHDLPPGATP